MKLVSQTQLQSAMKRARDISPFYTNLTAFLEQIPPPKAEDADRTTMVVLVTSNRGLCGNLNSQLLRDSIRLPVCQLPSTKLFVVGDRGVSAMEKRPPYNMKVVASAQPGRSVQYNDISEIVRAVQAAQAPCDDILIVYNQLVSAGAFKVKHLRVPAAKHLERELLNTNFDYETNGDELIANFYEFALSAAMYHAIYQNAAAEVLSRRNAMDGANKNCKELQLRLNIVFNKLRQALITTDLIEITSGAAAVEEMNKAVVQ